MDKYHIYEEIGKGEFSQVYKGREKKTIEYVAIKRSEKSVMNKIVNEVQIIHRLNSPHILRFHDWYETRNNIWLILEYCTGGDLESLLHQDVYLPESSVRMFGLDILTGLKHIHCAGFIHCDLAPKNILIDEYGILKISDFKYCRKVPKTPLGDAPLESRGNIPYMSPELFAPEGVHSVASDFWALGCLLYELRRGVPPFGNGDTPLGELVENIRSAEPIENPVCFLQTQQLGHNNANANSSYNRGSRGSSTPVSSTRPSSSSSTNGHNNVGMLSVPPVTTELADLLMWMLEKAPMNRCSWTELAVHPFWGEDANDPPTNLPQQAVYDNLVRNLERARSHQIEVASMAEFGLNINGEQLQPNPGSALALAPPTIGNTPVRPAKPSAATPASMSNKGDLSAKTASAAKATSSRGSDSLNGSKMSGSGEGTSSANGSGVLGAALLAESKRGSRSKPSSPVVNADDTRSAPQLTVNYMLGGDIMAELSAGDKFTTPSKDKPREQYAAASVTPINSRPISGSGFSSNLGTPPPPVPDPLDCTIRETPNPRSAGDKGSQAELPSLVPPVPVATIRTVEPATPVAIPPASVPKGLELENCELMAFNLILHSSDMQVKPIVGNKAIETIEKSTFKAATLQQHFSVLTSEEVADLPQQQLDAHLSQVYKALLKCTQTTTGAPNNAAAANGTVGTLAALTERANVFSYLISIATVAEVANTVMNTQFLYLILKSLRQSPSTLSTNTSGLSSRQPSSSSATLLSALTNCRILAATVLALLIRYATAIYPPSSKNREDHILPTLVSLLREGNSSAPSSSSSQKIDPKLKRRGIAALGELVFYIAAQLDSGDGLDGPASSTGEGGADTEDKWILPLGAVNVILRCLKDDSDEIARHYAAKTIENVVAQGGAIYKKKFLLTDMAIRLLEMSQSGGNEALQATCGMAAAHIFHQVMTTNSFATDSAITPSTATTGRPAGSTMSPSGVAAASGRQTNQPSTPGAMSGGRFIARVLEKGSLPGIIENLRDGPTKLQQAYLNIINTIMCPYLFELSNGVTRDGTPVTIEELELSVTGSNCVDGMALKQIRAYLLKAGGLISVLPRLIEQGASSATRAKALLSSQLLCIHNPAILAHLAERRLTYVLMKSLDPVLTLQGLIEDTSTGGDVNNDSTLSAAAPSSINYSVKISLSMMLHIKSLTVECMQTLGQQLESTISISTLLNTDEDQESKSFGDGGGREFTPLKPGAVDDEAIGGIGAVVYGKSRTPTTLVKHLTPQSMHPGAENQDGVISGGTGNHETDIASVRQTVGLLRALMFIVSPHPTLRRVLLSDGSIFSNALAGALTNTLACRKHLNRAQKHRGDADEQDLVLLLKEVEIAVLGTLETISQVDIMDSLYTIKQMNYMHQFFPQQLAILNQAIPTSWNRLRFMDSLLSRLLPSAAELVGHFDGDVRVVAASALRRLVPLLLKSMSDLQAQAWAFGVTEWGSTAEKRWKQLQYVYGEDFDGKSLPLCLLDGIQRPVLTMRSLFPKVSSLLTDHTPIPQGAVRLLLDAILAAAPNVVQDIAAELKRNGSLNVLIHMLRTGPSAAPATASPSPSSMSGPGGGDDDTNMSVDQDPQLLVLLRILFERTQHVDQYNGASGSIPISMLEADIATSLVSVASQSVPIGGVVSVDIAIAVMDLLHSVLNFTIRTLAHAQQQNSTSIVESLRKHIHPIRALCGWLFAMLLAEDSNGFIELACWAKSAGSQSSRTADEYADSEFGTEFGAERKAEIARVLIQLKDLASRCLGILFDVYPDAVTAQLLVLKPIGSELPRCIVAFTLLQAQVELKTRIRLLKVLYGVLKMASALGVGQRVHDMIQCQDLRSALLDVANGAITVARPTEEERAQLSTLVSLAKQIVVHPSEP